MESLTRRQVRYWCFRVQNEISGGSSANDAPEELKKHFEAFEFFNHLGGWQGFGSTWDVSEKDPQAMVAREDNVWEEWEKHCRNVAKSLPKKEKPRKKIKPRSFKQEESVEVVLRGS